MHLDASQKTQARRIAAEMAGIARSGALPGSLIQRWMRCGRAGCRCHGDPPVLHGPYWLWTRKVQGKTVGRWLKEDQVEDYQPLLDNARKMRDLLAELQALTLAASEADPRQPRRRQIAIPPTEPSKKMW